MTHLTHSRFFNARRVAPPALAIDRLRRRGMSNISLSGGLRDPVDFNRGGELANHEVVTPPTLITISNPSAKHDA